MSNWPIWRALTQLLSILFIGSGVFAINQFLGFLVMFAGYFVLPSRLDFTGEYESVLGAGKLLTAGFVCIALLWSIGFTEPLGWSLAIIASGLLIYVPEVGKLATVPQKGKNWVAAIWIAFGGGIGLIAIWGKVVTSIIFGTFVALAALIAFTARGREKGMVGSPLILMMLFPVTSAAPETIGEPLFGVYWPQVQNQIDSFSEAFKSLSSGAGTLRPGFSFLGD